MAKGGMYGAHRCQTHSTSVVGLSYGNKSKQRYIPAYASLSHGACLEREYGSCSMVMNYCPFDWLMAPLGVSVKLNVR